MPARLKEKYKQETIGVLTEEFSYANVMQVPKLEKIVINMGVGDAIADPRALEAAVSELTTISGQKPSIRKSRRAISNFKLREGVNIGCMVTLRGERLEEKVEGENALRKERKYGKFERSFQLVFEADSDSVKASYENGILTVEISKPQEQKVKQIEIH